MYTFWKCQTIILILWMHAEKIYTQRACPLQEAILPCRCLVRGEEYQIWCSHSDLPRVLDGLRAVGEYIKDPIDEVIIENNFLPSLPGRTFFPLKILRLMLRYNSLERVSSDWLAGLQSTLVEIFIVEPQLRSLPEDSLMQLNALQAITIESALLKYLPLFSGLPNLRYLQVEAASLLEISPMNFKDNPSLEKIHISSSLKLTRLEENVFFDLPNLNFLNISYSNLSWVHPRAMTGLPLLKEIWFVNNRITDAGMVGRASRDLPQLEVMRLDYNLIDKLGEASFVDLRALKKIYLSNNRITELHHGAFHMVPQLRTLDLNKNMVRRVHPESFLQHSGSGLEELYLVGNDISHVAELWSVLDALPRLVYLDMRFNNLENIPFGALRGHPTLEYINLDFNKLHLIEREAFMAMPALRELRLKNNSLSDILEIPFWNLPALKGLDLSENFFKMLHPSFLENLPSLRRIDLNSNELTVIDPELFLPSPLLEHINISNNYITAIHPATFGRLVNLYELDVSRNRLIEFVPGLAKEIEYLHIHHNNIMELPTVHSPDLDLPALRMLDISSNRIQTIPKASLRTMPQLRRLLIGKNLLQGIAENSFNGLNQLEVLHLQGNVITHIHPHAFKDTTLLKEINLSNNRLDVLVPDLFKDTPLLKQLDLSKNQLAEILPGTLDKNLELENIDASYNVLVQLPITLYGLKNLRLLDLTSNRIKNIDPEIIGSLVNLKELRLSKNFIQELKQGSFSNLPHLKTLHLDNNEIEFVETASIRDLPVLKYIRLNTNMIKEIPNSALNNLPSLQVIELQDNQLRNIAPSAFNLVSHLVMLNLSNNNLADLEATGLGGIKSLEVLDVSNNRIARIASPSLEAMEWLVELRMNNNNICGIQGASFNAMPRLRVLSLRNNKMTSFPEQAVQRLRGNIALLDLEGNPLICGCNILWLQAWLQESSQTGPHCLDGTLLREIQLSRKECSQMNTAEMVAEGCEAEFLSAPGAYTTSQVFSKWMKLRSSKNITKENHLPPSPEESEYFYDEYVDYPYNENVTDNTGNPHEKLKNQEESTKPATVKTPVSTKSPHYTPGDTPTIYAASDTTKKTNIPQKINNSPSTSGFTFFGVPLSNLNLNNILGRGSGRMDAKLPSSTVTAERKTAIVNKPTGGSTGRSSTGSIPSNLPLKMQPPYIQPPTLPEIQTGFTPILPSYGGFKPIPDPTLTFFRNSSNNVTVVSHVEKIKKSQDKTKDLNNKTTSDSHLSANLPENSNSRSFFKKTNDTRSQLPASPQLNKENNTPPINFTLTNSEAVISVGLDADNESTTKSSVVETASVIVQDIATNNQEETTTNPDIKIKLTNIKENTNRVRETPVTTESISIITTEDTEIITTSIPKYTATLEIVKNTSSGIFKTMHVDTRYEQFAIEKNSSSSSSTPPISEVNQPQFKHGGRSTITKVLSPHFQTSNVLNPLPQRESKNTYSNFPSKPKPSEQGNENVLNSTIIQTDDETNWYFANYNKTNLEPYVARITNGNNATDVFLDIHCLQITLALFFINIFSIL
ncbi:hypothetical protein NQ315_004894 [Exocentrus adspersus]|uniref:Chaoptin n=1 Tax=Exocentrus adspersus TaxID=1586481 RepID=A0AAV8W2K5_9CUCU|nr:hypothetical protein NQ315_004894 [Exocentrus adspersus]